MEAEAGDVITANPGEVHDSPPIDGLRGWRVLYLDPALVARELVEEGENRLGIARLALHDLVLAGLFAPFLCERLLQHRSRLPWRKTCEREGNGSGTHASCTITLCEHP